MKRFIKAVLSMAALLSVFLLLELTAFAAPYDGRVFKLKQPDNTKVQVKVTGDEYYQRVESMDGYTLCRDTETGWICYAALNNDGSELVSTGIIYRDTIKQQSLNVEGKGVIPKHQDINSESIRRKRDENRSLISSKKISDNSGKNNISSLQSSSLSGNITGLTILINFPDESSSISKTDISNLFNMTNYTGYGNNGSMKDYYYDVSGGALTYTNSINGYYTAKHPKTYYNDTSVPYAQRAVELVTEALQWLDTSGFDFTAITRDSNNTMLAVNILYAGDPDVGWAQGIWPHQGWVDFTASDGVKTYMYEISNIGDDLSIDTICHENGHMVCAYPDLYDYDGDTRGTGNYSLMSGSLNAKNPPPPDPYCRNIITGWNNTSTLNNVSSGSTVTAVSNSLGRQQVYRWNGIYDNEYYMIENVQNAGRYTNFPDYGLLIWHVDQNGDNSDNSKNFKVAVVQADGLRELERNVNSGGANDLFHSGNNNTFNNTSTPSSKWYNNTSSGLNITNISAIGNSLTFVNGTSSGNNAPTVNAGSDNTFTLPSSIVLQGTVSDDGLPNGVLTTTWSKDSGPGTVTFENSNALNTTATVSASGVYVFRLTASDDALSSYDTVTITVNPSASGSLVAYYKFNETSGTAAADSSGNGKNAALTNATWAAGKYGNAVKLSSNNQYVSLPAGIVSGLNDFTITAWVKPGSISAWARIFDFGTSTNNNMFLTVKANTYPRFAITTSGSSNEQRIDGVSALSANTWTHFTVTLSGTTARLYINGAQAAVNNNMTLKPSSLGNTQYNYIGKSQYTDPYLNGMIDEFRIYNTALSSSDISGLYNSIP